MSPQDVDAAVRTVIGEASADPNEQQSVAAVIRNRANNTGASITDVVHAPHQFEAWSARGDHLASIDPSSPVYQKTLALISPVLSGKALGDFHADAFYAPAAQASLGREKPSWDDGSGQNVGQSRFFVAGGHYGLNGARGAYHPANRGGVPVAAAPPSAADLEAQMGLDPHSDGPQPTPPSPDELAADMKLGPQHAPQHQSLSQRNAQSMSNQFAPPGQMDGLWGPVSVVANTAFANTLPMVAGAVNAQPVAVNNFMAGLGIGKRLPVEAGDVYDATRSNIQGQFDEYARQHPIVNTASTIAGYMTPGGIEDALASGGTRLLSKVPGLATSTAGRVATRVGGNALAATAAGAGQAASEGGDAGDIAKNAALSGALSIPFGLVGEGLQGAAGRLPGPGIIRRAAPIAVGGALGAGYGYATGGEQGAKDNALTGAALGLSFGKGGGHETGEITPVDRANALDMVAKAGAGADNSAAPHTVAADALQGVDPLKTTAEALGPRGVDLVKGSVTGAEYGDTPVQQAITARNDPVASMTRTAEGARQATGIDPAEAQMDVRDQVDAARRGPAKDAYDAALTGKPVWTPELAELAGQPEVRTALYNARRLIGTEALADNPNIKAPAPGPQERMTSAELRARMQGAGQLAPGSEVSASDLMDFLRKQGNTYEVAPKEPTQVPTDQTWDMAKQLLERKVTRDAFGNVEPSSENMLHKEWTRRLKSATNDAIPGLADARAISGEYLSSQQAYNNGRDLWGAGKNAETEASFRRRYADLTPAEQAATQKGYMAEMYQRMGRDRFNPGDVAKSPLHRAAQQIMFGAERAQALQAVLAREAELSASGAAAHSLAKPRPEAHQDGHGGAMQGMMIAAAEHGPSIHTLVKGAVAGAIGKGTGSIAKALKNGKMTPKTRAALREIMAQTPQITAKQLRERQSQRREARLDKSTVKSELARHALRGVAIAAGTGAAHALSGLGSEQ